MRIVNIDLQNIDECTEYFNTKPNKFIIFTIYFYLFILILFLIWLSYSSIDIFIGCNGYIDEIDIKLHQYYANVFIGNNDFAKVNVGDNVRIEITAYPSKDYGYLFGKIESKGDEIIYDSKSNQVMYLLKVKLDSINLENNNEEEQLVISGMPCTGKIVKGKEKIISYLINDCSTTR